MASIRRRAWTTGKGEQRTAWVVRYADQDGKWRLKTFDRQRDAKDWQTTALHEIRQRKHVPESASPTVGAAAAAWIRRGEADRKERSTLTQRRQHVDLHILPLLGADTKLSRVDVESFRDELLRTRSRALARKVMTSLKAILRQAKMGHLAANVEEIKTGGRHRKRLEVGRDIPTPEEVRALIAEASGYIRALLTVVVFTGLRASEVRAIRWVDVYLDERRILWVRQRADKWNSISFMLKSDTSYRSVPMSPFVVNTLKEWKLARRGELVFGNGVGNVESLPNIWNRHLAPLQVAAGIVGEDGRAKYGLHAFRHFFASWRLDQGDTIKRVSAMLGHTNSVITATTYEHLMPQEDQHKRFEAGERALLEG